MNGFGYNTLGFKFITRLRKPWIEDGGLLSAVDELNQGEIIYFKK